MKVPEGIRTDMGSVGVVLSPSVLGALDGAFEYMRDYPYECWEQKLSKGVMASHYLTLARYVPKTFEWPDAKPLIERTLSDMSTHQAPNGGMCFYSPQDDRVDIYLSAYTALALTWLRDAGYPVPEEPEKRLLSFLEGVLQNDSLPGRHSPEMRSSVRAVALLAMSRQKKLSAADLQRFKPALKQMSVFGRAEFLKAAVSAGGSEALLSEVFKSIMADGRATGAKLSFVERSDSDMGFMLGSTMRTDCAVLSSFISYAAKSARGKEQAADLLPKIARAVTLDRKRKDRWENTQENVFCLAALAEYSKSFEAEEPNLSLVASVSGTPLGTVPFRSVAAEAVELSRPLAPADAGRSSKLEVEADGRGRFYYSARLSYAPRDISVDSTNAGLELRREYSVKRGGQWKKLNGPISVEQGDLVKVDLYLRAPGPRNFVVVSDPVPGGLEPVNRDLRGASEVDAASESSEERAGWIEFGDSFWGFSHRELRHSAARFYSSYLSPGNYHLSYTAQAIAPGDFVSLPAHAEEMYDPDVFGESGGGKLVVSAMAGR